MALTHTHRLEVLPSATGVGLGGGSVTVSADSEVAVDVSLTTSVNFIEFDIAIDYSTMQSLFIMATQTMVLNTNANNGAGGQTINLVANDPVVWHTGNTMVNPITVDVTKIFVQNNSGSTGTFQLRALLDSSPP